MPKTKRLWGVSPAEFRVIIQVANGQHNAGAAKKLGLRPNTIKTHLQRASARMGARDRAHLVALCFRHGILTGRDILEERAPADVVGQPS